ncbi:MAG: DegT/DnrJ/EryC1/StrS family aminotransferase [Bacteroidota bacterium]
MVDLRAEVASLRADLDAALAAVLDATAFVRGPVVRQFEADLGTYLSGLDDRQPEAHVISCANGTDALQIALMALDVGPGDEVVCPSFTFVATAEAVALLGARPVFCDIEPETFNLDPARLGDVLSERTKAVVPVHLFGQMADVAAIRAVCEPRGIPIVGDAAQAIGGVRDGEAACLASDIGTLSFYPSKNLGAYGDGGAVVTKDAALAERIRRIANHGAARKYYHTEVGVNSRLDAMQAAILGVKLPHLPGWTTARRLAASLYDDHFREVPEVGTPTREVGARHVFHQYTLRVQNRDELKDALRERGIPTMVYYPEPIHLMPAYSDGVSPGSLPETERACREVLSLPMHPHLSPADVAFVAETVTELASEPVAV